MDPVSLGLSNARLHDNYGRFGMSHNVLRHVPEPVRHIFFGVSITESVPIFVRTWVCFVPGSDNNRVGLEGDCLRASLDEETST